MVRVEQVERTRKRQEKKKRRKRKRKEGFMEGGGGWWRWVEEGGRDTCIIKHPWEGGPVAQVTRLVAAFTRAPSC